MPYWKKQQNSKTSLFIPSEISPNEKNKTIKFCETSTSPPEEYTIEQFEERAGMTYLSYLGFKNVRGYEKVKRKTRKAIASNRISPRARHLGTLYEEQIKNGYVNNVVIKWVNEKMEYGLFAIARLEGGDMIGEYTGLVKPVTIFSHSVNEYCFRYPLYGPRLVYYTIDAKMQGNETSFINHSETPNCDALVMLEGGLLHMIIVADRTIKPGEQLLYDYGKNYIDRFVE